MRQFLLAFQFLTIIPVRTSGTLSDREIAGSVVFFPAVGAFQGLLAVGSGLLFSKFLPPDIVGGIIIMALVISNGGFHMDGIADTFDGLAVRSSGDPALDRKKRLSVMKDSATGALGVTAVALTILLKYLVIRDVLLYSPPHYSHLLIAPIFSKWTMVAAMYYGRPARNNGLGKIFIGLITSMEAFIVSALTLVILISPGFLSFSGRNTSATLPFLLLSTAVISVFCFSWVNLCSRRFGGLTGDTLGAAGELSEILYLLLASAWLRHSI
jgi:adenosylcobinamide-GDP ribazoletransferase